MSPLFGGGKKPTPDDDPGRPRSAAEREAARLERERRRAAREGRALPEPPAPEPPAPEPTAAPEVEAAPEPPVAPEVDRFAEPPAPAAPPAPEGNGFAEPPASAEPPAATESPAFAEGDRFAEEPAAAESPAFAEGDRFAEPPAPEPSAGPEAGHFAEEPAVEEPVYEVPFERVGEPAWEPEPVTVPSAHDEEARRAEVPAGVRRVASVADLPQVGGPRPTPPGPVRGPAGKGPRRRGVPRSRRGAKRVIPLLFLLLLVVIAYFAYRVFQPGHDEGNASKPVVVTIARGATAGQIADELESQGVIDSAFFFNLRSRLDGRRSDLKAGRFTLRRDMSYSAALEALTQNPATAPVVNVTLPEGRSISEAASLVRQSGVSGSYIKAATKNPRTVKGFKAYGVPKGTRSLEGFLFPATYELRRGSGSATASKLVAEQLAAFKRTFDPLDRKAAHRKNLNDYDILIIASMIEREAQVAKDRRLISSVIYNRLQQHIPLGIDATLRYRLDNWSRPLKQSELQTDSAFNTRLHQGLPPTPIGSPGLASIKAALSPAKSKYLYYVVKPCGDGAHAFSATDAEFQKDVAAYNAKRNALGGKDPSHC
jgi:UPF0755 protein